MKIKNIKAMTLIEIMITVVIFTFITGALYAAFTVANRSWITYSNNVTLQREARGALFAMTKELREASGILITKEEESIRINFNRPSVGIVSYIWSNNGKNANKVIRQQQSNTRVLASNISFLSFEYLENNAILVDITATRVPMMGQPTDFNLKEKVALRSKTSLLQ